MRSKLISSLKLLQAYELAIDENIISSITDTKGVIVYANSKFCEVSKYSSEELLGQTHRIINSGFHPKEFFDDMWRTIGSGNNWHGEIRNKSKDDTYYWVDTVIVPIKDEAGKNEYYLSLRTLITDRKRLENEKEQYLSSLETLLVMTSINIKKPLQNCLKQLDVFDIEKPSSKKDLKLIADSLKTSTAQLEIFSKELADFIRDIKK